MRKKWVVLVAAGLLASSIQVQAGCCGWGNDGLWDDNNWPEWTPMYWMEEVFDDDDNDYYPPPTPPGYYGPLPAYRYAPPLPPPGYGPSPGYNYVPPSPPPGYAPPPPPPPMEYGRR